MSQRTVLDCDRCGKPGCTNAKRFVVNTDRVMGPAGSSDDEWENVDLCLPCQQSELQRLIQDKCGKDYEAAKRWVKENTKKKGLRS